jgi:toxin CcdB
MARFDVHENPNPETSPTAPFLLDVQSDLLEDLATRVVVPLFHAETMGKAASFLNPSFTINSVPVVMSTAEQAAVPVSALGAKVETLREHQDEIVGALNFLLTGF